MSTAAAGRADSGSPDIHPRRRARSRAALWRLRYAAVCLGLTAMAVNTESGATLPDTKLDLVIDPLKFLARGMNMWDPEGSAGQLQNQAYGYLWPMGPFFALGHLANVPPWLIQRLWWALILCVAFLGVVTLAHRLRIGTPATRLVAGLAFALAPHLLTVLGPVSAEAWPMSLAAWVMVPLVGGLREGASPRRAGFLAGLAILCMGGVNAALDVAACVPALIWMLTRRPNRRWAAVFGWWLLAGVLATLWWAVPLVLLGRFSPPFLDYIESASVTTDTTHLVEAIRGTGDWIGYLEASGSQAGYLLRTQPMAIINTVLIAGAGLAAMAHRCTPHRRWLITCFLVGLVLVTMGHTGAVDGFGAERVREWLDGPLAPVRNVHKFDVAMRLPISLAIAAGLAAIPLGRNALEQRLTHHVIMAGATLAIIASGAPFVLLKAGPTGSFQAVPSYWTEAARWLGQQEAQGRALLVPGSRFGMYTWGNTMDEPIQALSSRPWDVRNVVPLTGPGHIRYLDAIEHRFQAGQGGEGLTDLLIRSGVRYLVVRNDLNYGKVGAVRPVWVHQTLESTPGLAKIKGFGPMVGNASSTDLMPDSRLRQPYSAVEIYSVGHEPDLRAHLYPGEGLDVIAGGPEAVDRLPVSQEGQRPAVLTSDNESLTALERAETGRYLLTDTPRRRETNFGDGAAAYSQTLTDADPPRIFKRRLDYGLGDGNGAAPTVSAQWGRGGQVTASSSASDADAWPTPRQSAMPFSAVDGDERTAWRPNAMKAEEGQWLELRFASPVDMHEAVLRPEAGSRIRAVVVTTDQGSRRVAVAGGAKEVPLRPAIGETTRLRITLAEMAPGRTRASGSGVAEIRTPGVDFERTLVVPTPPAPRRQPDGALLTAQHRRDNCVFPGSLALCVPGMAEPGEDAAGLDRTVPLTGEFTTRVWARPVPGDETDRLLASAVRAEVQVSASSRAVPDAAGGPLSLTDGDPSTTWVADASDTRPELTIRLPRRATFSSLQLTVHPSAAATAPGGVLIETPDGRRQAFVDGTGKAAFPEITTDRITLTLWAEKQALTLDPASGEASPVGLGISELGIPGVTTMLTADALASRQDDLVNVPCGKGPTLTLGGRTLRTSVRATVADILRQSAVETQVCDTTPTSLEGLNRLQAPTGDWAVTEVLLERVGDEVAGAPNALPVKVQRWDEAHREIAVGARRGPAVLVVHENVNAGWQATLGGRPLTPVTVDGWEQGFIVPAGASDSISLVFTPDRTGKLGYLAGGLAILVLCTGALWPARRGRHATAADRDLRFAPVLTALAGLALVGGWTGLSALAAAVALGGLIRFSRMQWSVTPLVMPGLTLAAFTAAGAVLAARPYHGAAGYAAGEPLVQGLCLVAVALAAAAVMWSAADDHARESGPSDAPPE
ncbi:MAG: DUF3367 domain-containing protein [Micrococcales bacterium]|nr:DUF3367 domain-containing protein [Micrococcales bacterium]